MLAYTYIERGKFALIEKEKPTILDARDAIVRVTLASICSSDLHIKHGSVPRAVPGITVGHEMVGIVIRAYLAPSAIIALSDVINPSSFSGIKIAITLIIIPVARLNLSAMLITS